MKTVGVFGEKGGTGKSLGGHLLCLGAYLMGAPALYVLTDPRRETRGKGRPYAVLDGKEPEQMATILSNSFTNHNSWLIVDGGGNRPEWDIAISQHLDLVLVPFRASQEDVDTAIQTMRSIPKALAWPWAWTTNAMAEQSAQKYIDRMTKEFPQRIIHPPVPFINSVSVLLDNELESPPTIVRSAARKAFSTMVDYYDTHVIDKNDAPVIAIGG